MSGAFDKLQQGAAGARGGKPAPRFVPGPGLFDAPAPAEKAGGLRINTPPPAPEPPSKPPRRSFFQNFDIGLLERRRFRIALIWVACLHLVTLIVAAWWSTQYKTRPPVTVMQLLPQGMLVRGTPGAQSPKNATAPLKLDSTPPTPTPPAPAPPVTPPAPTPPAPVAAPKPPAPVDSKFAIKDPKATPPAPVKETPPPKPAEVKPAKPAEVKPAKPDIKVDLTEVVRESPAPAVKTPAKEASKSDKTDAKNNTAKGDKNGKATSREETDTTTVANAEEIKGLLNDRLGKAGVTSANADGKTGIALGASEATDSAAYFGFLRDVYYEAWKQPADLIGKKLSCALTIRVAKDGTVLDTNLTRSSGNPRMDASVGEAAAKVKNIGRPLPDALGLQFGDIEINFEF